MSAIVIPTFTNNYHKTLYPRISPSSPSLSVKGKTAVVTGGSRGIGRAIARNFILAGANVFIIGRSESNLINAVQELSEVAGSSSRIGYMAADVVDGNAVKSAFAAAAEKFGQIDILINNAGYVESMQLTPATDLQDFWNMYEVNVKGSLTVIQNFLSHARENATIINMSSGASMGVFGHNSAYSSSKLALVRIFDYLQAENPDMRFFSIHPGYIKTDMTAKAIGKDDVQPDDDISKFRFGDGRD
jgi:NAD(P)-dependent dehydrogenase (short-subunit alcohol dehydrogenase family)